MRAALFASTSPLVHVAPARSPLQAVGRVHPEARRLHAVHVVEERAQPCERVFAAHGHGRREREVVHAAEHRVDLVHAGVEQEAEREGGGHPLVAESDRCGNRSRG